jgi:hypothetical protein
MAAAREGNRMNEAEWLSCADPERMLDWLRPEEKARKLRLFAVACTWRVADALTDSRSKKALKIAGRYADGSADEAELLAAHTAAVQAARSKRDPARIAACDSAKPGLRVAEAGWVATEAQNAARKFAEAADQARKIANPGAWRASAKCEQAAQAALLRDLLGNPFRPVAVDPDWLSFGAGTVVQLAQAIYDGRRFEELPVLADALEEAGCTNPDILGHCRGPGPHVRGCWVVDLILGKQ